MVNCTLKDECITFVRSLIDIKSVLAASIATRVCLCFGLFKYLKYVRVCFCVWAGGSVPVFDEVILSMSLMNKVMKIDPVAGQFNACQGTLMCLTFRLSQHCTSVECFIICLVLTIQCIVIICSQCANRKFGSTGQKHKDFSWSHRPNFSQFCLGVSAHFH